MNSYQRQPINSTFQIVASPLCEERSDEAIQKNALQKKGNGLLCSARKDGTI